MTEITEATLPYHEWKRKLPNDISHIDSTEESGVSHAYKMGMTPSGKKKYKIGSYFHNSKTGTWPTNESTEDLTESEFEHIMENMTIAEYLQLDELSKDTLKSYVKKAVTPKGDGKSLGGMTAALGRTFQSKADRPTREVLKRKVNNRIMGIHKAVDKLAK